LRDGENCGPETLQYSFTVKREKKDFDTDLEKNLQDDETLKKRHCETLVFEVKELQDSYFSRVALHVCFVMSVFFPYMSTSIKAQR